MTTIGVPYLLQVSPVHAARPHHHHQVDGQAAADEHQHGEVVPQLGAQVRVGRREVDRVGRHGEVAPERSQMVSQTVGEVRVGERTHLGKRWRGISPPIHVR